MSTGNLLAGVIFSSIGLGAFIYGKRAGGWKPMSLGIVLMAYPYFIANTWMNMLIGCALTAGLFVFRD